MQTVGVATGSASRLPLYRRWHDALLQLPQRRLPEHGAIWLTYYPHIMVEWYPHVLVSTLHPRGPQKTLNMVEFFYPEEIAAFEREFVERTRPPTWRPASKTTRSPSAWTRAAGADERGDNESGPYQSRWKTACSSSTSGTAAK